jgi:gluconate 5-dehydrogenase
VTLDLFDLHGRTALVTGSSRGIGHALARGLARAGAQVVLNGRRPSTLEQAVQGLRAENLNAHACAFDVTDEIAVEKATAAIEATIAPIHILVNNAGMQLRMALQDFPTTDFRALVDINLTSAFLVGRAVGARMLTRGTGTIINVCSLQSELARPTIAPYAATKGALKMLTRGMCADWAPHGLTVNGIAPGYFATELTQGLRDDVAFDAWLRQRTPMGRWGELDELVGAAIFLASPASSFVNGQIIYVDGGISAVI